MRVRMPQNAGAFQIAPPRPPGAPLGHDAAHPEELPRLPWILEPPKAGGLKEGSGAPPPDCGGSRMQAEQPVPHLPQLRE